MGEAVGSSDEVKRFVNWLNDVLAENGISEKKRAVLAARGERASGGTSMISTGRICKDLEGSYLPEWSYVVSNYLDPIGGLSEAKVAEGLGFYKKANHVAVPYVPRSLGRESISRILAPLLAGFSVPAIVSLAASKPAAWRDAALALMVAATGFFLFSFQMSIGSVYAAYYEKCRMLRTWMSFLGIGSLVAALVVVVATAIGRLWVILPLLVLSLGASFPMAFRLWLDKRQVSAERQGGGGDTDRPV